jgi:hypothetical protein
VNGRSARSLLRILVSAVATVVLLATGPGAVTAAAVPAPALAVTAVAAVEPEPVPTDVPVDTVNPFLPEEVDLTSCIGMLQRPGCGSEARGGWRQYAVAGAMMGGLVLIFGRVAWGIRRSQKNAAASLPE